MAKKLRNPIEVKAIVHFEGGVGDFHISDVSIHSGMFCEHGDLGRARLDLEQNQEILNIVKDFLEESIKQKEVAEGIVAEDSILDNGDAHHVPESPPEP